jgi:hypothetical protein
MESEMIIERKEGRVMDRLEKEKMDAKGEGRWGGEDEDIMGKRQNESEGEGGYMCIVCFVAFINLS